MARYAEGEGERKADRQAQAEMRLWRCARSQSRQEVERFRGTARPIFDDHRYAISIDRCRDEEVAPRR